MRTYAFFVSKKFTDKMPHPSINRANINVRVDKDLYQEISALLFSHYKTSKLAGHTIGLSFEPVTPYAVRESNRKGGNPGGWQEVNQICEWSISESNTLLVLPYSKSLIC